MAHLSYTIVTDLQWMNEEHTYILCKVKFDKFPEPVFFGAVPNDSEEHCVEIFNRAVAGDFGPISEYIPPPPPAKPDPNVGEPNVIG